MARTWYRINDSAEVAGLTAGTTIEGVREAQMQVLKKGFKFPDGRFLHGAPPILPEEWFGFGDSGKDNIDMFIHGGVIREYVPTESELAFAYEHMFPALKPTTTTRKSRKQSTDVATDDNANDESGLPLDKGQDDGE